MAPKAIQTAYLLLWAFLSLVHAGDHILIPYPSGRYNTSLTQFTLTDGSRSDPYAAKNISRALRLSLFYPRKQQNCTELCREQYMPYWTADGLEQTFFPEAYNARSNASTHRHHNTTKVLNSTYGDGDDGILSNTRLQVCCEDSDDERSDDPSDVPLTIFSPEVGTSRLLYGALAQHVASNGYAVVTVDHPYDAAILEYLNESQTTVYGNVPLNPFRPVTELNETVRKAVEIRTQDIKFMLDQLNDATTVRKILPTAKKGTTFWTSKVGVAGHGLGGATAVALAANDSRVAVGIDIDGTPLRLGKDIRRPVVFFGRENHTRVQDATWSKDWNQLKGSAYEWDLRRSDHFDYSDIPLLADLVGENKRELGVPGVGDINSRLAWNVTTQFTTAFLDIFERSRNKALLKGLVDSYGDDMVPYGGLAAFRKAFFGD